MVTMRERLSKDIISLRSHRKSLHESQRLKIVYRTLLVPDAVIQDDYCALASAGTWTRAHVSGDEDFACQKRKRTGAVHSIHLASTNMQRRAQFAGGADASVE